MKRKTVSIMLVAIAMLALSPQVSGGVITHTATYDMSKLRVGTMTLGGVTYSTVDYDGLFNWGGAGTPWLPVEYFKFSVPYNAAGFSVSATSTRGDSRILDYPVYPRQASDGNGATLPDNACYSADTYPTTVAWVVDEGMMAGENHVVTVAFMPLTCSNTPGITGLRTVNLARDVQLTLSYGLSESPNVCPLVRKGASLREKGREITRNAVVNPDDVAANAVPLISRTGSGLNRDDLEPDEVENPDTYMIIASQASLRPLRRLAALKMQEGYPVKMVTIEDVLADPIVGLGDSVPGQGLVHATDAGKLRQYLRHYHSLRGTEYALLAGTGVPYFYHEGGGADIYFSELNVDWITHEDPAGEIFVGRLLGSESRQFDNYTDKLLRYELNPGNGNLSYLRKGLIIESNAFPLQTSTNPPTLPVCTVFNCITHEEEFTGNDVINMIKNNHYGYLSTFNKGFPSGISIYEGFEDDEITVTHYLWAIDTVKVAPGVTDTETGNGLNRLDNRDYPMVYISPKGKTIPYSTDNNYNVSINYGESFTMGKDYGGPAYIGSTGNLSTDGEIPTMYYIQSGLFSPYTQIGQVFLTAKSYLSTTDNPDAVACENLLGDPSLDVWSDQPQQYSGITVTRSDNGVTVSGINVPSTVVSYHSNDGTTGSCVTSSSVTLTDVSPNSTIMLKKHNCIPYIAPLVLQNTDLDESQYVFATDVTAGRAVDSGRTAGGVTVKEGAEYEIEASGEVTLAGGFQVELGARFSVQRTSYK